MTRAKELVLYIDGASRGNPGPASVGVLVESSTGEVVTTISELIGNTTNNVAEYSALIFGLQEAAVRGADRVTVHTDSELVARQFNGQYKVKEPQIRILWKFAKRLSTYFKALTVDYVPREQNRDADRLANEAFDAVG